MMDKISSGKSGEKLAKLHYEALGYELLEQNYRYKRAEIDLIMIHESNQLLVFLEVKKRSRSDFGEAESFVSDAQQERIKLAAEEYIYAINWKKDIRFDIVCIDGSNILEIFEDAF